MEKKLPLSLKDESGQMLLFVVAAMVVALVVGIGIAVQLTTSTYEVATGDSAQRALAAAEACIERFLVLSTPSLGAAKNPASGCPLGTTGVAGTGCHMTFDSGAPNDPLQTEAMASVSDFGDIPPSEYYSFDVDKDATMEVFLNGYGTRSIQICWSATGVDPASLDGEVHSDIYYTVYGTRGSDYASYQGGVRARNPQGLPYSNDFSTATQEDVANGYNSCTTISWPSDTFNMLTGLRIMSLNFDSSVGVKPIGDDLPLQGYEITCTGEVSNTGVTQKVTRTISVRRSFPFMPVLFDFGIFAQGEI